MLGDEEVYFYLAESTKWVEQISLVGCILTG